MGRLFDPPKPPPMPAPVYLPPPPPLPAYGPDGSAPADRVQPFPTARTPMPAPNPPPAPVPAPPTTAHAEPGIAPDRRSGSGVPRRRWRPDTLATGWRGVLAPRDGAPRRKTLLGE